MYSNPNLLDNSDFANPVNQRRQASYSGSSIWAIDRYRIWGDYDVDTHTLSYNSNDTINRSGVLPGTGDVSSIIQRFFIPVGTPLTFSCGVNGKEYSVSYTITEQFFYHDFGDFAFGSGVDVQSPCIFLDLTSGSIQIEWMKLEKGSIATPYVPKGYGAELAECRRYYQHRCRAIAIKNNIDYYSIAYRHGMRTIPTATLLEFNYAGSGAVATSFGTNDILN